MSRYPHGATYEVEYGSVAIARSVAVSIGQEVGDIDDDRSTTRLDRTDRSLTIEIEAADLVALRAATNTWLSLAGVAERVAELVPDDAVFD